VRIGGLGYIKGKNEKVLKEQILELFDRHARICLHGILDW
jgi:hypothetical protein